MKMIWRRLRNQYYQRHLRRKDLPEVMRDYLQAFHGFDFNRLITETEFVVFDTETTGIDALDSEIVALALSWEKHSGYLVHFTGSEKETPE